MMTEAVNLYLAQLIISIPLLFVLFFGIGFILNMILKTTWLPLIIFFGVAFYVGKDVNQIFTAVNAVLFFSGLAGAIGGIWTIKTLRQKGYRMF
ncbi:YuiB-like putative membrane protein [Laceyella sediminis]|uniref:YuiB-like putative membrane protein n=2 Tax=Laceyella sediminis TaxID=573074 RepID=A0ABX5ERG8_9BACL|nr:YuiB-like putative membrane protein [Laceyella sediminis]